MSIKKLFGCNLVLKNPVSVSSFYTLVYETKLGYSVWNHLSFYKLSLVRE